LQDALEFAPRRSWQDENRQSRLYSEMLTGEWAWQTQSKLPAGSTLIPVLLGSDKTHLTVFAGDKKAWPLYLSLGNIKSSIRNKPKNRAWVLVAYLPIAHFTDHKSLHTTLQNRLFHQCMSVILEPLKHIPSEGLRMVDSMGAVRLCFPTLAAYLADYPEQVLINVAASNASPTTTAAYHDLGAPVLFPPRTKDYILRAIDRVKAKADPANVEAYQREAKLIGLNGVDQPFWKDLPGYTPNLCVAPDILHGVHRFWRDHVLKWVIYLVGEEELDRRVKAIQPVIGFRHFKNGISHLSQWTGREDRELQRILLAAIAGAPSINREILHALRGIHDFAYLAQYHSHCEDTLRYMKEALNAFHSNKKQFIDCNARRGQKGVLSHFNIPKLYALLTFVGHIRQMGACPQYSTEVTESCHQIMAKQAYRATNKRDYEKQMCRYLDRSDRISLLKEVLHWWRKQEKRDILEDAIKDYSSDYQTLARALLLEDADEEMVSHSRSKGRGHIWLNLKPHHSKRSLEDLASIYSLPRFLRDFATFLSSSNASPWATSDKIVDTWLNCRIQLPLVQDEDEQAAVRTVQALPPSSSLPYGRCSCVLITEDEDALPTGINGYRIAQVRLFFRARLTAQHPLHMKPLVYVQWFSAPQLVEPLHMFRVERLFSPQRQPLGCIVELTSIARFIQLIPEFGPVASHSFTANNSMNACARFFINSFADKEIYQAIW
ncbi:hypothetical protein CPB86DRAFT_719004, partial [Serendipita vermifera]